jgi:hypothetical protein
VLAGRAAIGANMPLSGLDLRPGVVSYLRISLTLPTSAGNDMPVPNSDISFSFSSGYQGCVSAPHAGLLRGHCSALGVSSR